MSLVKEDDDVMKSPEQFDVIVTTTEMHTGGEPVRIIESGFPVPQGATILDKIEDLRKKHDKYRKFTMLEPHGHFDMYGVLLVTPDHPEADIGTIFLHNEGYSTMCGHACISMGRYAIDRGLIRRPITFPETQVNIQTPCGLIKTFVNVQKGDFIQTGRVRFSSVPCFVVQLDVPVDVKGYGKVVVDVVYGGAFYAFVTVDDLGLDFKTSTVSDMKKAATAVKAATKDVVPLSHPETPAFLYGTIIVDTRDTKPADVSTNVCIFADAEADRSPCGSGTSARTALMYHRGHLSLGQGHTFRSGVTGSEFIGRPVQETTVAGNKALITEVAGHGYYSGRSTLTLEKGDVFGKGFLVH